MTDFTAPISWPVGLDVTESILNQQVRDNIKHLKETTDALESSVDGMIRSAIINVVPDDIDVDTTTGIKYLPIPSSVNGMDLIRVKAFVTTAGTTNATTIQVRNITRYSSNDSLSSAMSIASGGTSSSGGSIDTSYDDVLTDDILKIYVTGQSTVKPKGLYVVLEFQTP
jgi:hypothetical protein